MPISLPRPHALPSSAGAPPSFDGTAPAGSARPSRGLSPLVLTLAVTAWVAGPLNTPLWRAFANLPDVHGLRGALFGLAFAWAIAGVLLMLLALLSWPRVLKPTLVLTLLSAALASHFIGSYGVVIDASMVRSALQTDTREAADLLNLRLAAHVLLLGVLPALLVLRTRLAWPRWPRQARRNLLLALAGPLAAALVLLPFSQDLAGTMRNHRALRYMVSPLNAVYALGRVAARDAGPARPPTPIGLNARAMPLAPGQRPPLVMLVVGETARADHFALNGYTRPTNPALTGLDVLSFRQVASCGTSTAVSVPCMFSPLGRVGWNERTHDSETLLDLLQHAGLAVLWLDNQAGCKGVCDRVPHATVGDRPSDTCRKGEGCLDEALLDGLDARLAELPADRRARGVVLVLHQMGSHGPAYSKRSPPTLKPFQPECRSSVLQDCPQASLINTYDNSIVYTDQVLARAIGWLKAQTPRFDPSLYYVSDHGESLGEHGLYLHGMPYAVAPVAQTHVPMVMWLAPQTLRSQGVDLACLNARLDAPLSHDHLFATVMGLAGVQAREYRAPLDVLAGCRAA